MPRRLRCCGSHECTPIRTERYLFIPPTSGSAGSWRIGKPLLQLILILFYLPDPTLLNSPGVSILQEPANKLPACKSPSQTCFSENPPKMESTLNLPVYWDSMRELESKGGRKGIQKSIPSGILTISSAGSCSASGTDSQPTVGELWPQL